MHTYPFHAGDFLRDTVHFGEDEATVPTRVGLLRELAYRRLLDLYYAQEGPIPNKTHWVATRVRMLAHADIVGSVLKEKFVLDGSFWRQKRADAEIAKYQKRVVANQENGKKGGRKPTENPPGNPLGSKPRTRTRTINTPLPPEGAVLFDEFWKAYPKKKNRPAALRAFTRVMGFGSAKATTTLQELMAGLAVHVTCRQWVKDGGAFIPDAASWLNANDWNLKPVQPDQEEGAVGWWATGRGFVDKGLELGLPPAPPLSDTNAFLRFRASVIVAAGDGPWWDDKDTAYPLAVKLRNAEPAASAKREAAHA